jgi:transposase
MKKETKLLKKLSYLLNQLNCREYLHHFGPKKFKLKHHLLALISMEVFKLSLRRVEKLFEMFEIKVPTYSALCKSRKKIPTILFEKLVKLTSGLNHEMVAIDSTGFSKTNPSFHYIRRIDSKNPVKSYAKFSILYDVKTHKVIIFNTRIRPSHDINDVRILIERCKDIKYLLADKAYCAEWLHEYCFDRRIKTIIPDKINAKRGFYRKKQQKNYSDKLYHKRSNIESGFSAIKRKYGGDVRGKSLISINSELSCKVLAHNLRLNN